MILSKRLLTIASLVPPGGRIADVGTDHGYIPIYLVKNGVAKSAIAMDVRSGPLSRAAEHVEEYGLSDRIELRLSDGLNALSAGEADTVVISGLGGPLMVDILERGKQTADAVDCFVLSPQSDIPGVRIFLRENDYRIEREAFVLDDGKYYTVMQVFHGESRPGRIVDDLYGRDLLDRADPVLGEFLQKQRERCERLLPGLLTSPKEETRRRAREVEEELSFIRQAQRIMEEAKRDAEERQRY